MKYCNDCPFVSPAKDGAVADFTAFALPKTFEESIQESE